MHPHLSGSLIILLLFLPCCLSADYEYYTKCAPSSCGSIKSISYPFRLNDQPENCSHPGFNLSCTNGYADIEMASKRYRVMNIYYDSQILRIVDEDFIDTGEKCPLLSSNTTINTTIFNYTPQKQNITLYYNCPYPIPVDFSHFYPAPCSSHANVYAFFTFEHFISFNQSFQHCNVGFIPVMNFSPPFLEALESGFELQWKVDSGRCEACTGSGGRCGFSASFTSVCFCRDAPYSDKCPEAFPSNPLSPGTVPSDRGTAPPGKRKKSNRALVIGLCAGLGGGFLLVFLFGLLYWRHREKHISSSSNILSRNISCDPYSKSELEKGIQTQIFTYRELEEATNNFDSSKELGDGGFGTVYHGKLRDGRVVAIKRLYDHNYKRVEQFKNEIDILSPLRHQNLVSLYGCSSRHSRELLLVYEFIPNGTVANHLHGDRVKPGVLTWPIRLSIAIETADALAYLHKVDVIHRDVKTDNILLDNNFCVKVADFGLSRLFPMDVTHVSTAPQGTPGYVDPDYHKCYQLTDKSDVYSFGVVLVELISSMPAVDITRHRHEINLANMAINKIHNDSLHELVDSTLGFDSDFHVRRMITLVAELAFRCLQDEKDVRPSMEEVLEVLRSIANGEDTVEKTEEVVTPVADDTALLKKFPPPSPVTVTDAWGSRRTTPNTSG